MIDLNLDDMETLSDLADFFIKNSAISTLTAEDKRNILKKTSFDAISDMFDKYFEEGKKYGDSLRAVYKITDPEECYIALFSFILNELLHTNKTIPFEAMYLKTIRLTTAV